jgi:hypothetical protein
MLPFIYFIDDVYNILCIAGHRHSGVKYLSPLTGAFRYRTGYLLFRYTIIIIELTLFLILSL